MIRVHGNILSGLEKRAIERYIKYIPQCITPDNLTFLSASGAAASSVLIIFNFNSPPGLLLTTVGIFLNWFGDSFDGALARYRKAERENYGFWIDRTADTVSFLLLFSAIACSGYCDVTYGIVLPVTFLIYQCTSIVSCLILKTAKIGTWGFGATEARITVLFWVYVTSAFLPRNGAGYNFARSFTNVGIVFFCTMITLAAFKNTLGIISWRNRPSTKDARSRHGSKNKRFMSQGVRNRRTSGSDCVFLQETQRGKKDNKIS